MRFITFDFDSNQITIEVKSPKDWSKVLSAYAGQWFKNPLSSDQLMQQVKADARTKEQENSPMPKPEGYLPHFGLRAEHCSCLTLKAWAKKNGMYDLLV